MSRSVSRSPELRRRSISLDRMKPSPRRQSLAPRPKCSPRRTPPGRKSYRRRSRSQSPHRSHSHVCRRLQSPYQYRSHSLVWHRSPSPVQRLSLARHGRTPLPSRRGRSPSPSRRPRSLSPARCCRSPSPARLRRSPSPGHCRPPRRSPSPVHRRHQRSPTPCHRSPSPVQHRRPPLGQRRSLTTSQGISPSRYGLSSPSSAQHGSPSSRLPLESPREGHRLQERSSLITHRPSSMMSLQPDLRNQKEIQNKVSVLSSSPEKSPIVLELASKTKRRTASEDGR
ncbi:hypothetical protein SLEP1_g19744 [Rubroshorea leprosula]|uniref:Uncharacterized protein n=1 Tax=Rubroshorea leprosula TaxID=152421 RepID=A0AAV5J994_9ROSI|nr:hypothetical protein SLEP1_g19744 [Rubroshorea leprosula]